MRKTLTLSSLVVIVLWSAVIVRAQDAEFQLRLAQSLEQGGEWDRAAAMYERLHHSEPDNEVYVQGLQRSYLRLREYGKAIDLVNQQIKRQPANVMLPVSLGGIYYESGSEQQADSVWNHVIQSNPSNIGVYRVVAAEMLEHRLFPQAIHAYLEGRTATGNENAFTDDLANLYTVLQQYEAASKEFIRLLKQSPQQLPFIESRIGSFTIRDAGLQAATSVTR
ncbi:MAG TPA: tetratricopeptide repeat protein, partial [Terriglobia bacterium]|nr:tetratricopeptide repeat protein [Terriglobia bacterium]